MYKVLSKELNARKVNVNKDDYTNQENDILRKKKNVNNIISKLCSILVQISFEKLKKKCFLEKNIFIIFVLANWIYLSM